MHPRKPKRKVAKAPYKVLDAPSLQVRGPSRKLFESTGILCRMDAKGWRVVWAGCWCLLALLAAAVVLCVCV
jgi:hypothetical protein